MLEVHESKLQEILAAYFLKALSASFFERFLVSCFTSLSFSRSCSFFASCFICSFFTFSHSSNALLAPSYAITHTHTVRHRPTSFYHPIPTTILIGVISNFGLFVDQWYRTDSRLAVTCLKNNKHDCHINCSVCILLSLHT